MKTIIAGSRTITDYDLVKKAIDKIVHDEDKGWKITEVVSGGARGIDKLGERWANENNVSIKFFHADWDRHGKAAGFIRNKLMANYADCLISVWDGVSRGTANMITEAKGLGLHVVVIYEKDLTSSGPIKSNPIKSNPIFGKQAQKNKKVDQSVQTITLNGASLVFHSEKSMNPDIVNFCVELYKEIKK